MNASEKMLSEFSSLFFYNETVFDNLKFKPTPTKELEFADLLINLGDVVFAVQLKGREESSITTDKEKEQKWFKNNCDKAKKQLKGTISFVKNGGSLSFTNKRGEDIAINPHADIVPLVVFNNSSIYEYPHILRKHSDEGLDINCISFSDFKDICQILVSPIEILNYLKYRLDYILKLSKFRQSNFSELDEGFDRIIVKNFIKESYDDSINYVVQQNIIRLNDIIHLIPEKTIDSFSDNDTYKLILILSHMDRECMSAFYKFLKDALDNPSIFNNTTRNVNKVVKHFFIYNNIFWSISNIPITFEESMQELEKVKESLHDESICINSILNIFAFWEDNSNYRINFYNREI